MAFRFTRVTWPRSWMGRPMGGRQRRGGSMTNATKSGILVALVAVALLVTGAVPFVARPAAATWTTWAKVFGGYGNATGFEILPTADGGYAVLGEVRPGPNGNFDMWLLKLSATGAVEWQYFYGGP